MIKQQTSTSSPIHEEIEGYINMPETGDYAVDCATGRRFADALIHRMGGDHSTPLLGTVARGIVETGRWTPMCTGFFQRVAERCATAA